MRSTSTIRIAIADPQPIFRLGVRALLAQESGFNLVGEAENTHAVVALVHRCKPDVLILEHLVPHMDALEVVRMLKAGRSLARTIIFTAGIPESHIQKALLGGVWGVVLKSTPVDVLPECIRQVMAGERWIGLESVNPLVGGLRTPITGGSSSLTPREVDIIKQIARGASNKAIARKLEVGEQTVKNYLRRIFRKLQVAGRVELALLALEQQLVRPEELPKDRLPPSSG
jgi:DNA-binding NarL/FixJ family response regulator